MIRDTAHRLIEYLSRHTGDGFRTVVIATNDGYGLGYIHDDLSERYTERTLTAAIADFQVETSSSSPSNNSSPAGERRTVIYYYENAFVLQSSFPEAEQIIVSIGTGFGADLPRFIKGCRRTADREN